MKQLKKHIVTWFILLGLFFGSCKKFEQGEGNEEEVITTMNLYFAPATGGAPVVYSFDDADGPGGNPPTQSEIVLAANTTYNVRIELLNKTVSPADTITTEVEEEAEAHRFYYSPAPLTGIPVITLDDDNNGAPLGIHSRWTTGTPATGSVKITLRHYPGTPPDKQEPDAVNSPKSTTDVDISFTTKVL